VKSVRFYDLLGKKGGGGRTCVQARHFNQERGKEGEALTCGLSRRGKRKGKSGDGGGGGKIKKKRKKKTAK